MKAKRSKNFASILYPDSCDPNFIDLLKESHVNFLLSPLHDKDKTSDGEDKKPHYHIILIFDSLKSLDQVRDVLEPIGAVGCEIVNSLVSYGRYLCHLDDKDKYQYSTDDVVAYGYDYQDLIASKLDKYDTMARVLDFCINAKCYNFSRLLIYARHNDFDMFKVLCDNSYMIREFLRSAAEDVSISQDWVTSDGFDSENPF